VKQRFQQIKNVTTEDLKKGFEIFHPFGVLKIGTRLPPVAPGENHIKPLKGFGDVNALPFSFYRPFIFNPFGVDWLPDV
jgi:hypothetical protein